MLRKSGSNSISVKPQLCGHQRLTPRLDVALEIALLLLKVLRLQEQPFGPDDPIMRGHVRLGGRGARDTIVRKSASESSSKRLYCTDTVEVHGHTIYNELSYSSMR